LRLSPLTSLYLEKWVVLSSLARRPTRRDLRSGDDRRLHLADHLANWLAILHLHVASYNGINGHAFDLPAAPWRGMVFAVELLLMTEAKTRDLIQTSTKVFGDLIKSAKIELAD
jgi:hypothetical protein